MKPALKKKWLAALRSGDYKQCRKVLHIGKTKKFCCMGVLALVGKEATRERMLDGLPEWQTLGGLDEEDGSLLAEMNDAGKSFAEIADYIEKNL